VALDRKLKPAPAAIRQRAATVQRSAAPAARPRARALQERLGNQGTQAFIARAALPSQPARLPANVSKSTDVGEVEAEKTARNVVRMRDPPASRPVVPQGTAKGTVQRADGPTPLKAAPAARVNIAGGAPLPSSVRSFMEPRFGASFANVRVHTGEAAANQAAGVQAKAFTAGEHVFFGRDAFQPQSASGRELIAHELTHVIQQGSALQRSAEPVVAQHSEPRVQRIGLSDALDWIADKARYIPGFTLLTVVLGVNPINMRHVERTGANILRGLLELIPIAGPLAVQALDNNGAMGKAGAWVEKQVRTLGLVGNGLKRALDTFLDSLSLRDILHPSAVWERAKHIFTEPIDRLIAFGKAVMIEIKGFIHQAIVVPLAKLAEGTRGYDLLKAVLGHDPITGEAVPRNADTLIGGFMKLIGQEEVWENLKKSGAVARAWTWFQKAVMELAGFVRQIPGLFVTALKSLEWTDLLLPWRAFIKVVKVFGSFLGRFLSWAGSTVWNLLEIIFEVVSPSTLAYLRKTGAAIKKILRHPMDFMHNIIEAGKQGFNQFSDNFLKHLKEGLIDWLTGSLPGVYIPKDIFSIEEVLKFVFSILGITWDAIRAKVAKVIGEPAMKFLEGAAEIVPLMSNPAAAWKKIQEKLGNFQEMVVSTITDLVVDTIVAKAIPKLISFFIPGVGFISAIISIYDAIKVFVQKIATLVRVVKSFLDSMVDIANGKIDTAAQRVENAFAGILSLAINVLATFVAGNVTDKVRGAILKLRAWVDKGLDAVVNWILGLGKKLLAGAKAGVKALIGWWKAKTSFTADGETHSLFFQGEGAAATLIVQSDAMPVSAFLDAKEAEAKGDKTKKEAIKNARALLKKIENFKSKKPADDKEQEKLQKEVIQCMNDMGAQLVLLLDDKEWGTKANPLAFGYPKRPAVTYIPFYLSRAGEKLTQQEMKDLFDKQKKKDVAIVRYLPTERKPLPDETETLGIIEKNQIATGTILEFHDTEAREKGVSTFKKFVARFGFVASDTGLDIDHVVELQLGGEDVLENLWPLPKGENRSSGATLKSAKVELPGTKELMPLSAALEGQKKKTKEAKQAKKTSEGLWLIIRAVKPL